MENAMNKSPYAPVPREICNTCLYYLFQGASRVPVIKRLYPSLQKLWARLAWPGGYKIKRYRGLLYIINYRNLVDRKIGMHGGYENSQSNYLFSRMGDDYEVFLDIGANIGVYSLLAAQSGLVKEIHAFEPDPRNYAQLMGNIYLNKFTDRIEAHPVALSSASGTLPFEMGTDAKTNLTKVGAAATGQTRSLQARALDEMLPYTGRNIAIKIDVEGHESDALKGASKLLANNNCLLQIEIWEGNREAVLGQLAAMGYKPFYTLGNDYYLTK